MFPNQQLSVILLVFVHGDPMNEYPSCPIWNYSSVHLLVKCTDYNNNYSLCQIGYQNQFEFGNISIVSAATHWKWKSNKKINVGTVDFVALPLSIEQLTLFRLRFLLDYQPAIYTPIWFCDFLEWPLSSVKV